MPNLIIKEKETQRIGQVGDFYRFNECILQLVEVDGKFKFLCQYYPYFGKWYNDIFFDLVKDAHEFITGNNYAYQLFNGKFEVDCTQ